MLSISCNKKKVKYFFAAVFSTFCFTLTACNNSPSTPSPALTDVVEESVSLKENIVTSSSIEEISAKISNTTDNVTFPETVESEQTYEYVISPTANIEIPVKRPFGPIAEAADGNVAEITEDDIIACVSLAEKKTVSYDMYAKPIIEIDVCDLDFDGQDEVLVYLTTGSQEIYMYEKVNGEMEEDCHFGLGQLNKVFSLDLHAFHGEENYAYFIFHYDGNAHMDCDVLAAIKRKNGEYYIDYLLSWGTLQYEITKITFIGDFYRKGWNNGKGYIDITLGVDYDNIIKEEFVELYRQYTGKEPILQH